MREKTCCFTGHREIPLLERRKIKKCLESELVKLINQGIIYFGAGGALGFDTLAAQTVLSLRRKYPQIKLILVLPCRDQALKWSESDREKYKKILEKADKIVYTSEYYHAGCMHKRNRHMIDNSSVCVCYLKEIAGGTAYTVNYAKNAGLKIINLAQIHR